MKMKHLPSLQHSVIDPIRDAVEENFLKLSIIIMAEDFKLWFFKYVL
jgi:hypothetical protein